MELSRKLMLSGFVSFMGAGSIAQSVAATLISFFFFALTGKHMPFEATHLNMIKIFTEFQIFGILLVCIVIQTDEQGFATEAITLDGYGSLQTILTVAVLPITVRSETYFGVPPSKCCVYYGKVVPG